MRTIRRNRFGSQSSYPRSGGCSGLVYMLLMFLPGPLHAGEPEPSPKPPTDLPKQLELLVDPAPEPFPALRYSLLLPSEARKAGSAAPIYLRLVHERHDEWRKQLGSGSETFLDVPFAAMSIPEAEKFLDRFANVTVQLSAAARRTDCQWEYVLEGQDPLLISLSDSQSMRAYGRLLCIKARYEIRGGKFDQAVSTMQDNLALARHVANGPFIVSRLVGVTISSITLDRVQELLQQPGAPNLYWALASLPRPLIAFDGALVMERQLLELKFPELAELDRLRSAAVWQRLAQSLRNWAAEVVDLELSSAKPKHSEEALKKIHAVATADQLQAARNYLQQKCGLSATQVQAAVDAEIEVRHTLALYREMTESWQKWFSVPYPLSLVRAPEVFAELKDDVSRRELFPLSSVLLIEFGNVLKAQARLDRQITRLQTIEALRMHAAATGQLPERLDEIAIVPVPADPVTGKPFQYSRQKDAAVLTVTDQPDLTGESQPFPVQIRLRMN